MPIAEDLIPEAALCERFGFKKATLACWRSRRKGPPYLVVGRRVFYPRGELEAWLKAQVVDPADLQRRA